MAVEIIAPTGEVDVSSEAWRVEAESEAYALDAESSTYEVDVETGIIAGGIPYTGDFEFTPNGQVQTIASAMRTFDRDVVINPIPSNYGLITWDGSIITVS